MTTLMNETTMMTKAAPVVPTAAARVNSAPAIESTPVAGGEITIKIGLTPGAILLGSSPIVVAFGALLGWVVLTSFGRNAYVSEMFAAAIVNTVAGIVSALPVYFAMKRGTVAIAQTALFGIAIRCGLALAGLVLAVGPGWGLERQATIMWTLILYFPLLMAETACIAWLCNKATK